MPGPTRLEDLIALNALYRPGPMDLIPTFVARKNGREQVEYPHPLVAEMLSETYGIMVYQEQVMQTAQILGGYSLGGADLLRRAMGKKKAEEMAEHRQIFRDGAAKNGIVEEKADEIFDLMEKFAGYGFNKSHAAAYSLLAYHTGWLKVHYTAEFFCANMTVEMDDTDKLKVLFEDAQKNFGLTFEPPNVNRGVYRFEPVSDKVIRYGLGAVKGTGQQAIDAIVKAREEGGPFTSLYDFCVRVDRTRINKRTVEALIKAGAFDALQLNRASMVASIDRAFDFANATEANANQGGLFDMGDSHAASTQEPPLVEALPWGVKERLTLEKTAVGFYLSGHLFDEVALEVRRFARRQIDDLIDTREPQLLAGIVNDFRVINGQRGKLALFKLDDKSAMIEATADEAVINANRHLLKDDELIIVMAKMQPDRFSGGFRLSISQVWDLATARCRFGKFLRVAVNGKAPDIKRLVREFPPKREISEQGELVRGLGVRLSVKREAAVAELQLGEEAKFFPSDAALASWMAQADQGSAQIVYETQTQSLSPHGLSALTMGECTRPSMSLGSEPVAMMARMADSSQALLPLDLTTRWPTIVPSGEVRHLDDDRRVSRDVLRVPDIRPDARSDFGCVAGRRATGTIGTVVARIRSLPGFACGADWLHAWPEPVWLRPVREPFPWLPWPALPSSFFPREPFARLLPPGASALPAACAQPPAFSRARALHASCGRPRASSGVQAPPVCVRPVRGASSPAPARYPVPCSPAAAGGGSTLGTGWGGGAGSGGAWTTWARPWARVVAARRTRVRPRPRGLASRGSSGCPR